MTTTARKTAGKLVNCACSSFEFGEFDGGNEAAITYDTDCHEQTKRTFAMGHDAKLVGFLVRAELAGEEIALIEGGMMIHLPGAVEAAAKISDALAAKARYQLDAARARVAKKAAREAAKAARTSKKAVTLITEQTGIVAPVAIAKALREAPTTRQAKIKVGRWTYDATIALATGTATFAKKLGGTVILEQGGYTEVA